MTQCQVCKAEIPEDTRYCSVRCYNVGRRVTHYRYSPIPWYPPMYRVHDADGEGEIGWCRRRDTPGRTPSHATRFSWEAHLNTDPTVTGTGRTRDDAVDDAYQQVGGPD